MVMPVYRLLKFSRWNPTHILARGHLQVKTHYLLLKRGQPGGIPVSWLRGREPSGIAYPDATPTTGRECGGVAWCLIQIKSSLPLATVSSTASFNSNANQNYFFTHIYIVITENSHPAAA
jgi:hypothetical protein